MIHLLTKPCFNILTFCIYNKVDDWNLTVQQMNPNFDKPCTNSTNYCKTYYSSDKFTACDDPNDVISEMLSEDILNKYNSDNAPTHVLKLCVGDICYLLRTLSRKTKYEISK